MHMWKEKHMKLFDFGKGVVIGLITIIFFTFIYFVAQYSYESIVWSSRYYLLDSEFLLGYAPLGVGISLCAYFFSKRKYLIAVGIIVSPFIISAVFITLVYIGGKPLDF